MSAGGTPPLSGSRRPSPEPRIRIIHRYQAVNLLHIPKMMCDRCVPALHAIDGTARVEADLMARTVRVVSRHYESALLRTLREAGFHAEPILQPLG